MKKPFFILDESKFVIWLPEVKFENGMLGTTRIDEDFSLHATPLNTQEPPNIEDPIGSRINLGNNTLLEMRKRYQVFLFSYMIYQLLNRISDL